MRISSNHILSFCPLALAVCLVFCALTSAEAQTPDFDRVWTTIGSAGTVDEADVGKVFFENGKVQMGRVLSNQSTARGRRIIGQPTQSAVIRYNVTGVDGLFTPIPPCRPEKCIGPQLTFRFIAEGSGARVVAKLIEVDLETGIETVRLTIEENGSPAAKGYRFTSAQPACIARWRFDFQHKAFYVEATLTTKSSFIPIGSVAGIQMIKIGFGECL